MSYVTVEVEIDHGKIVAKEPEKLPEKATGWLTIQDDPHREWNPLEALEALQRHLKLDAAGAQAWMDSVREARR